MYVAALVALTLPLLCPAPDIESDLRKADRQFERSKWASAADAYTKVTAADPTRARAWFNLGYSLHALGEYERAITAHRRASEFDAYRPTALYNVACAATLLGRTEEGGDVLEDALAAGFLDYDTMATDADIAPLREAGRVTFAPRRRYAEYRHRNGVEVGYEVIVPKGEGATTPSRAVVCFAPGRGRQRSADWLVHEVLGGEAAVPEGWIVVVLVAPEEGWMSHPAHHALEGLLRKVRDEHAIDGRFHAFGYADGARPATTYARMSRKDFDTLTVVSSRAWASWDDPGRSFRDGMPVHVIVGGEDATALAQARAVEADFEANRGNCRVTVVPDGGRLVPGLRGAGLFSAIASSGEDDR